MRQAMRPRRIRPLSAAVLAAAGLRALGECCHEQLGALAELSAGLVMSYTFVPPGSVASDRKRLQAA